MGYTAAQLVTLMRSTLDEASADFYSDAELGGWLDIGASATATWSLAYQDVERIDIPVWGGDANAALVNLATEFPSLSILKVMYAMYDLTASEDTYLLYPGGDQILLPGGDKLIIGTRSDVRKGMLRANHGIPVPGLGQMAYYSHFGDSFYIYPAPTEAGVLTLGLALHTDDVTVLPDEAQYAAYLYAMSLAYCKDEQTGKAGYMFALFKAAVGYLRHLYDIDQPESRQEQKL